MSFICKKTLIALMIFLAIPFIDLDAHLQWQPESTVSIAHILLPITESAGSPWALITATLLFILFCLLAKTNTIRKVMALWVVLFVAILSGQIIKSVVKHTIKEPRPYVLLMEKTSSLNHNAFYALQKDGRKAAIQQYADQNRNISPWLAKQWQSETDYSLPSGHTLFSTTWVFLALLLLGFKKHKITVTLMVLWAALIETSRLVLGMHHPIDLIVGVLLAWVIAIACYWCAKKWHLVAIDMPTKADASAE